jgi:hypothetical protein
MDQHTLATTDGRRWAMEIKEVAALQKAVVGWRVMFGEIVSQIISSLAPVDSKLVLCNSVPDPVETHVNGFGATLLDSSIGNA